MDYRDKAIHCVKDTVLPMQRKQFEECGCCLDEQYKRYGNTEWLFAEIIEEGVCPEVVSGKIKDVSHCECSRQSVLYIIGNLLPDKNIRVEIIETVLGGAEKCRFKVTVE